MLLSTPSRRCGQIMPRVCTAVRSFQILFLKIRKNGTGAESGLPPSAPCLFRCNGRIKRRKVHCRGCVKKNGIRGFFYPFRCRFYILFSAFSKNRDDSIPCGDAIYTLRRYYLYLAGSYYTSQRYSFTSQRYFYIWQMSAGTMLGAYFSFMDSRHAALSNPGSATTSAYRVISLVAVSYFM